MQHVNNTILQQNVVNASSIPSPVNAEQNRIDEWFNGLQRHDVSSICWLTLQNVPEVKFVVAYQYDALCLKYYVKETTHLATYRTSNEPVFKDSCVEFFIAINESGNYYNFEFNSLGTCLASYGKDRHDRLKLAPNVIAEINSRAKWINHSPATNQFEWELTVILPVKVFCFDVIHFQPLQQYNVNFYKCGDNLPEPHYLAWNPVRSTVMDFHQPHFFGALQLV
jgi:hypothetical protein